MTPRLLSIVCVTSPAPNGTTGPVRVAIRSRPPGISRQQFTYQVSGCQGVVPRRRGAGCGVLNLTLGAHAGSDRRQGLPCPPPRRQSHLGVLAQVCALAAPAGARRGLAGLGEELQKQALEPGGHGSQAPQRSSLHLKPSGAKTAARLPCYRSVPLPRIPCC